MKRTPLKRSTTLGPIQLTAKMLEARDTMLRFWGERYDEQTAPIREAIRNHAANRTDKSVMSAALDVCKRVADKFPDDGMIIALCIAAAVEECDQ